MKQNETKVRFGKNIVILKKKKNIVILLELFETSI